MYQSIFNLDIKTKCKHYKNNMNIYADCCNKYFDCYLCHNNESDHKITAKNITKIKCLTCTYDNDYDPQNNKCKMCNTNYSLHFCNICFIWDNRSIFHCYKCNECKFGYSHLSHHCDKCKLHFKKNLINLHKCEYTLNEAECSICLNNLIYKIETDDTNDKDKFKVKILNCGHLLHTECYNKIKIIDGCKKCPLCRKDI